MAIYHLSVKTISRSAGRSATAAAAYRAGDRIADDRTGELHDYGRKRGIESAELILPAGAPEWASDRALLWNAAEQAERRKNSTVAREFEIALPAELSAEERARLARDFAREIVQIHGCAADVCIHAPSRDGDQRNHHAHILLTTRRLGQDGLTEKTRELDDKKDGPELVKRWRERFAVLQNERLREAGLSVQVDHRSLEAQGVNRAATRHLGPAATGFERRTGRASHRRRLAAPSQRQRRELAAQVEKQRTELESAKSAVQGVSGALQAAQEQRAAERAERRAREERKRIASMNSRELAAEIERIRPPDPGQLAEADPTVIEARKAVSGLSGQREEAEQAKTLAERQEAAWRREHPRRAALHDRDWWYSAELVELEERQEEAQARFLALSPRLVEAQEQLQHARTVAQARITDEQRPARERVAELEALRQEKARQERAEAERQKSERIEREYQAMMEARQQAEEAQRQAWLRQEQAERDQVVKDFASLAARRQHRFHGFRDGGKKWEATPEPLQALVDGFNAMPKPRQERVLQGLRRDPEKNEMVGELLRERRQNIERNRDQDHGLSM